jgi:hypothetical protein
MPKPKSTRKQTCGTRRGNGAGHGAGWGGPGTPHTGKKGGRPPGVRNGEGKAARARERAISAAEEAVERVIAIMRNEDDQRSLTAALAILNRVGLHEKSGVEVTGTEDGPVKIKVEIVDERDDAEAGSPPAA